MRPPSRLLLLTWTAALALTGLALLPRPTPTPTPPPPPTPAPPPPAPPPLPPSYTVDLPGTAEAPADRLRTASVDLLPVIGRKQRVDVRYDLHLITRPTTYEALRDGPDWVAGVRLLLGEMGAWRLRDGRWSLLEAVGILETVQNRFNPDLANPLRIAGVADWPGCGVGGTFASCIHPRQYLGLASDRALRPRLATPDEALLLTAIDRAVAGWFVYEEALLGEITAGATSFVHQCGGARYGQPSTSCTGPDAARGPIAFRGPSHWLKEQGRYALSTLGTVDYVEAPPPTEPRAYIEYLLAPDGVPLGRPGGQ